MREHEMRMRVVRFLKVRMRNMILPATLGLGLSAGCRDATVETTPTQKRDSAAPGPGFPIYSIPFPPEAGPDGPSDSPSPDLAAQAPDVPASPETAPVVDAAAAVDEPPATIDGGAVEAGTEVGGMTTKYVGSMPPDAGTVLRYMAPMPYSGGGAVPLYLALGPDDFRGSNS